MKFDFSNSQYVRMFEDSLEGRQIITYILNDPNMIRANFGFWKTQFPADASVIPTDKTGRAAVRVDSREPEHATMADWRGPLGNSRLGEEGAAAGYNAGIIDLITKGWQEQAMEREYKEKIFQDFGSDAPLLLGYATDVLQPRIDSINMSLSNMAAQALSTGRVIYTFGQGIQGPVYEAPIPAANKVNAGEKAWNDPDCKLLDQMAAIEKHFREEVWGRENMALEWCIEYSHFHNVVLKNKQVIEFLKINWLADKGQLISQVESVPNSIITADAFNTYVAGRFPGVSPIRVISEKQRDEDVIVSGWKPGIAVLKPRGFAGKTFRTDLLDKKMNEKYGNSIITKVFGSTMDGIATVVNTTGIDGQFKYWATDVMASAVPVDDIFLYQVLVDTSKADTTV